MRVGLAGVGRIGAFHAETLRNLDTVDELVVTDIDPAAARRLAQQLGVEAADSPEQVLASGVDGWVIATATPGHAPLLRLGDRGRGADVLREAGGCDARRDHRTGQARGSLHGARPCRVPAAVRSRLPTRRPCRRGGRARLRPHRACQHPRPVATTRLVHPHERWALPRLLDPRLRHRPLRDGSRGQTVFAVGANKGASFFSEAGDVDTAAALLTLDDGTLVTVSATRYNGAGHDVRMEVIGSRRHARRRLRRLARGDVGRGGRRLPGGPRHWSFMERFLPAYRAELTAFADGRRGSAPSPCTVQRRPPGFPRCRGMRAVAARAAGRRPRRDQGSLGCRHR